MNEKPDTKNFTVVVHILKQIIKSQIVKYFHIKTYIHTCIYIYVHIYNLALFFTEIILIFANFKEYNRATNAFVGISTI